MTGSDGRDPGFEQFERFLDGWSRRDFIRRMGGAAALAIFTAGGLEFLEACGGNQTAQSQNVKTGGHLTEGSLSDPTTFNGVFSTDTASSTIIGMMFAGLIDLKASGDLIPVIAKEVPKVESDQLTYKFNLRQDVKWSDGQPLTADDVVFTYSLMAGSTYDYKAINSRYWPDLEQYLASVTAPDKYTVIMKTKLPYAPFLTGYVIPVPPLPKHVLEPVVQKSAADFRKADFNFAPTVVSGPFMFDRWDKSQQVVVKANPGHYLGRPNLDSYVIKTVSDGMAIANQLKTGEIDFGGIEPSLWDDMATANNVNRISFGAPGWDYYAYNMDPANQRRPVTGKSLGDPSTGKTVRQALYYAVDRKSLADKVYFKQADVATTVEPPTSWALSTNVTKYPYDPKKASDLLDQAGWKAGPDGVRVKDGVRLSFEVITNVGNKARETTIQVLAESWKKIGVEAQPKPIQFTEYVKTSTTRDFDMVMGGIASGVDPDLSQIYHSRVIGKGLNRMGYHSPQLDDMLDKAVQVLDQSKRKQIYAQVQQILMDDLPAGMLVWPRALVAVSKRVQNFGIGPFNRYQNRPWLKDVFVTDGK
jgi:peptide/nickel transport system substrate-binding protein